MALGAFDDIVVACVLIYHLVRMRTGFHRTDKLITIMIAYVVNSGAVTAVISLLVILMYLLMKDSFMYQGAYCLAGRVYGVAVIGTLNQRRYFRDMEPGIMTDSSVPLSDMVQPTPVERRKPVELFRNAIHSSTDTGTLNFKLDDGREDPATISKDIA